MLYPGDNRLCIESLERIDICPYHKVPGGIAAHDYHSKLTGLLPDHRDMCGQLIQHKMIQCRRFTRLIGDESQVSDIFLKFKGHMSLHHSSI